MAKKIEESVEGFAHTTKEFMKAYGAVSYTHLTLPTKRIV